MGARNLQGGDKIADFSSAASKVSIFQVRTEAQIEQARELFLEYAQSLGFSLCFQGFEQITHPELPGDYAPAPWSGSFCLQTTKVNLAGCVALHPELAAATADLDSHQRLPRAFRICEMKRLYLRQQFRGKSPRPCAGRTCDRRKLVK